MSGHQPQRPYGPLYNPHLPTSSSPALNFGMQRYPNQPPAYNSYWHGQNPPSGMPFSQNTNGYVHHLNAQSSVPPAFPARVAPTAYGGYPGMPQYSAAPTQFFSAPPSSAYPIAPHLPQPQVISNTNAYESFATHPPNQPTIPAISSIDVEDSGPAKEPSVDLEDGELNSEEHEKSSGDNNEKSVAAHEQSAPETPNTDNMVSKNAVDQVESSNAVKPNSRLEPDSLKADDVPQDHSEIAPSIREQARRILRELHSLNIGFEDIARESFDVNLLRELYMETGLPTPEYEKQKHQANKGEAVAQAPVAQNGEHEKGQDAAGTVRSSFNVQSAPLSTNHVSDKSAKSNSTNGHTITTQSNTPAATTQEPILSKSTVKAPAAKPLDRKDYIARLMAAKIGAKAGKPQSSEGAQDAQQVQTETNVAAPSAAQVPTDGTDITPTTNVVVDHAGSPLAAGDTQDSISDLETKRKVQTDLALQKMEALRAQKKLQEQPQSSFPSEIDSRPAPLEIEIVGSVPSNFTEDPRLPEEPKSTDGRQTSYFSPVSSNPAFSIPGLFTMAQEVSSDSQKELSEPAKASESASAAEEGNPVNTGTGPRKRLKAADFMDLTPSKLHKSLSNGDDVGVVIDISDDESENAEDGFDAQTSGKTFRPSVSTATRRENQDILFVSPPDSNTPGRLQEPKDLKMKESEIQSMNRKILELEQRIKAKQAASRLQSPRPPILSSNHNEPASDPTPPSIQAPQHTESATEEQLLREKEKQEDRLATAEAEQLQIANRGEECNAKRPFDTQESSEDTILQRPETSQTLGENGHLPDLTNAAGESIDQQRTTLENELSMLDTNISSSEKEMHLARLEMERLSERIDVAKLSLEQRRSELQSRIERRQLLQQQFSDLSKQFMTTQESQYIPDNIGSEQKISDTLEAKSHRNASRGVSPESASVNDNTSPSNQPAHLQLRAHNHQLDNTVETEIKDSVPEPAITNGSHISPSNQLESSGHLSNAEAEEDIMDISGSDVDEGEVLEARRESASKQEEDMDTSDDGDYYEPPSHIGSIQQASDHMAENEEQIFQPELDPLPEDASPAAPRDQADEEMVDKTVIAQIHREDSAKQALDHSFTGEDGKDEDDYEPPEPENSNVENTDPITRSSPLHESASIQSAGAAAQDQQLTTTTAPGGGSFIPYESPLKQFSSYRFHPEFRNEVSGGYRSLTYSNDIKPDVEICQYELSGGVCNDASCTSQHFQKMMLPDHIILSAMGKGVGATPEEKDEYIKGLRSLILDLRERNVKDLDAIAEAIAQYRLKFLDDSSRVLPL